MDHIYHEGNGVVDRLAKFGYNSTRIIKWEDVSQTPSLTQVMIECGCTSHITIQIIIKGGTYL